MFTRIFIFHETIHETRAVTLSAGQMEHEKKLERDYPENKGYIWDQLSYPSSSLNPT